jgi:Protein of unknown function (DUF4232)
MTSMMPKLVSRRLLPGALVAALAGVALTSSAPAGAQTAHATPPRCKTAGLQAWLGVGGGGAQAGSVSYPLELTNISGHTCTLFGFPGLSAISGGTQAGSAAARNHSTPSRTVTLRPGATVHADLSIADVSVFAPAKCRPVTADGLRVYPPGAFRATTIPFRFRACSAKGPLFLHVTPVQPRVGVPGRP